MKRFAVYTLILTVLCLCFTGCSDYSYEDGIDALNEIEAVQASSTVDTDLEEPDDGTEKAVDDGDEETDIYALFDNLFEENEQGNEKPADTENEKTDTEEEQSRSELSVQPEQSEPTEPTEQTEQTEQTETTESKQANALQESEISDKEPVKEPVKEQPVRQETTTVEQKPTPQPSQQSTSTVSGGVWIPQSGTKYHSHSGCSNMKNPSNVTLEEAQRRGFTACKRCY